MTEQTTTHAPDQAAEPPPDLQSLEMLVGTWTLSGETTGTVAYDWMEGGFFLLQHMDMEHAANQVLGAPHAAAGRACGAVAELLITQCA